VNASSQFGWVNLADAFFHEHKLKKALTHSLYVACVCITKRGTIKRTSKAKSMGTRQITYFPLFRYYRCVKRSSIIHPCRIHVWTTRLVTSFNNW